MAGLWGCRLALGAALLPGLPSENCTGCHGAAWHLKSGRGVAGPGPLPDMTLLPLPLKSTRGHGVGLQRRPHGARWEPAVPGLPRDRVALSTGGRTAGRAEPGRLCVLPISQHAGLPPYLGRHRELLRPWKSCPALGEPWSWRSCPLAPCCRVQMCIGRAGPGAWCLQQLCLWPAWSPEG